MVQFNKFINNRKLTEQTGKSDYYGNLIIQTKITETLENKLRNTANLALTMRKEKPQT